MFYMENNEIEPQYNLAFKEYFNLGDCFFAA